MHTCISVLLCLCLCCVRFGNKKQSWKCNDLMFDYCLMFDVCCIFHFWHLHVFRFGHIHQVLRLWPHLFISDANEAKKFASIQNRCASTFIFEHMNYLTRSLDICMKCWFELCWIYISELNWLNGHCTTKQSTSAVLYWLRFDLI